MKRFIPLLLFFAIPIAFSCSKEQQPTISDDTSSVESTTEDNADCSSIILKYYDGWNTLIQSMLRQCSEADIAALGDFSLPQIGKLNNLKITDKEGVGISFDDMPVAEKSAFIAALTRYLGIFQSVKLAKLSSISEYFSELTKTFQALHNSGMPLPEILKFCSICSEVIHFDNKHLIDFGPVNGNALTLQQFLDQTAGVAQRGDYCVILPLHNHPLTLMNLSPIIRGLLTDTSIGHHSVGHSAVMTKDIEGNETAEDALFFGAVEKGVLKEPVSDWLCEFYIAEAMDVTFKWDYHGGKGKLDVVRNHFSQEKKEEYMTYTLAYEGSSFIDSSNLLQWLDAKRYIPNQFTCAGLIWWSTEQVYGFDMSNGLLETVLPLDILLSPFVDIKAKVCSEDAPLRSN